MHTGNTSEILNQEIDKNKYEELKLIGLDVDGYLKEEKKVNGESYYRLLDNVSQQVFLEAIATAMDTTEARLNNADEILKMAFESVRH